LSSKTLPDLLKILQLPKVVSAQAAPLPNKTIGTVFFTAPLYRPNLHYKVLSKPPSAKGAVEAMSKWITENRPLVIFCLIGGGMYMAQGMRGKN
jgi:ATP-dependent DNA helicase Q1